MAEVTKSGLEGVMGQLVFYSMNGKNYVRTKPRPQSARTKKKLQPLTGSFGRVSSISSKMAAVLRTELNCPFTLHSYNTLRGWMLRQYRTNAERTEWPLSVTGDGPCQLNPVADLHQIFRAGISATDNGSGRIILLIDAFNPVKDIKAPAGAGSVNLKLLCAGLPDSARGSYAELTMAQYAFDISNKSIPAFEMELTTQAKKGSLLCLALAVEFRAGNKQTSGIINIPGYLPVAGVGLGRRK